MGILDQIQEAVKTATTNLKPFDPSTLNDDVAMKTEWTPAKLGGASRQIYEFAQEAPHKLQIKVKPTSYLFPIVFMMSAFIPIAMGIFMYMKIQQLSILLFTSLFSLSFFAIGFFILLSYRKSMFFDKENGYYWKGKEGAVESAKIKCRLIDIHAIQIIKELVSRSSSSNSTQRTYYNSFELNLVLKDGSRFNVLDHSEKPKLFAEAEKVAQFLGGKPIWDGTIHTS